MIKFFVESYNKIKKQLKRIINSDNRLNNWGDTAHFTEHKKKEFKRKNNLNQIKITLKESIKFQVEQENFKKTKKLLSHLKEVMAKIEKLNKTDEDNPSDKCKDIS